MTERKNNKKFQCKVKNQALVKNQMEIQMKKNKNNDFQNGSNEWGVNE